MHHTDELDYISGPSTSEGPAEIIRHAVARTLTLCTLADMLDCDAPDRLGACAESQAWYADHADEFGGTPAEWDDAIPEGSLPSAWCEAADIIQAFEEANSCTYGNGPDHEPGSTLLDCAGQWEEAVNPDDVGLEFEHDPELLERFGHCLAMMAMGHGVGLADDLPPGASFTVPNVGEVCYGWATVDLDECSRFLRAPR